MHAIYDRSRVRDKTTTPSVLQFDFFNQISLDLTKFIKKYTKFLIQNKHIIKIYSI